MMTISELCTLRMRSEPGAYSGTESFSRGRWCMIFFTDSPSLARWRGHGYHRIGIPSLCSKEDTLRPYLPRHFRTLRGCYGFGMDLNDARSERTGPQGSKLGVVDGSSCYKVREGDTLTSVANSFKVSVRSIAILNDIADIDYIPAGKLLIIPYDSMKTGEVAAKISHPSISVETQTCEDKSIAQSESSLSVMPAFSSAFGFQSWHVRLALSLLVLLAISSLVRRYISQLRTRHDELLQCQVQREIQEAHHQPKLRRWQGILDDDRRVHEVDGDLLADSRAALDVEEENLRQTYAQLESAYVKFLADSGLSKSGYWRGGVPPALEEK